MGIQWDTSILDVITQKGTFTNPCFFCQFWIASFIFGGMSTKMTIYNLEKYCVFFCHFPKARKRYHKIVDPIPNVSPSTILHPFAGHKDAN